MHSLWWRCFTIWTMMTLISGCGCWTSSKECYLKLDEDPANLIQSWGYPVEQHSVSARDRAAVNILRIPYGRHQSGKQLNRPPVFLQSGPRESAAAWIINLPHQCLAFILADAGFDVWIANYCGNPPPYLPMDRIWNDHKYFFTEKDVLEVVNYVLRKTGFKSLTWIGHSEGATIALANLASKTSIFGDRIRLVIAMAPAVNFSSECSSKVPHRVCQVLGTLNQTNLASPSCTSLRSSLLIRQWSFPLGNNSIDNGFLNCLSGLPRQATALQETLKATRISLCCQFTHSGQTMQNAMHYASLIERMIYAFGFSKWNTSFFKHFSSPNSKSVQGSNMYNFTGKQIAIFYGGRDSLVTSSDVRRLLASIPQGSVIFRKLVPEFDHLGEFAGVVEQSHSHTTQKLADFLCGKTSYEKVYHSLVQILHQHHRQFKMPKTLKFSPAVTSTTLTTQ